MQDARRAKDSFNPGGLGVLAVEICCFLPYFAGGVQEKVERTFLSAQLPEKTRPECLVYLLGCGSAALSNLWINRDSGQLVCGR